MIAHISLSHLSDPGVALTAVALLLLYTVWRAVLRPHVQEEGAASPARETNPAAS